MSVRSSRAMSAVLAAALITSSFTPITSAFASAEASEITNRPIDSAEKTEDGVPDESHIIVDNGDGSSSLITMEETETTRSVLIENQNTGEKDSFVLDKTSNLLYSTRTGKTIDAAQIEKAPGISTRSSKSTNTVYKFSWKQIKDAVGSGATAGNIVGGILALTGAGSAAGGVTSVVSSIIAGISGFIPSDTRHGITATITTTKWYRNGKNVPYRTTKTLTGVWVY
ncbi:MAG: hypothetical protein E7001_06865 [Coriobacteriaceae bacterium]|nr:hypothetical protein [Coriobacteriaceae bacterium]